MHAEQNVLKPWQKKQGCLGKGTADCLWRMEARLALYAEPYAPTRPPLCFDALPYPLLAAVREPWPPAPGKSRRQDYEYARAGTWKVLLACEPLTGTRYGVVSPTRTQADVAHFLQPLAHTYSPDAQELRVVLETLSTHTPVACYQTFAPQEARPWPQKLAFHYPPVHGSWLTMAACECSALRRQCLKQRSATQAQRDEIAQHWAQQRTETRLTAHWQFPTEKAREKCKRFYPH